MSVFIASGKEVRERAENGNVTPSKNVFIRLKDGDAVRIAFFPNEDDLFKEYYSHSDFRRKIFSHPCIIEDCPSCKAGLKRQRKVLIPVYDLDADEIRIINASITQFTNICRVLDDFKDENVAFKYTRSGSDTKTVYTLTPIFPSKLTEEDKKKLEKLPELRTKVTDEFMLKALNPKTREQILEMLNGKNSEDEVEPLDDEEEVPF